MRAPQLEKNMSAFPERPAKKSEEQAFPKADATQPDLLAHYGIKTVPLTSYEWGGYRYSYAHDAIAAAKRGEAK